MSIEVFTIARGNSTMLVEGCPQGSRLTFARNALKRVEQVGFIEPYAEMPTLQMMGGELSINGTIAFARRLGGSGQLKTSGLTEPVQYFQEGDATTIKAELPYRTYSDPRGKVVTFEGIGYLCTETEAIPRETLVRDYWNKYNRWLGLPAFGFVLLNGESIQPFVYVKETDSLVSESACGSGSIAASIVTGNRNITQPSLGRITVLESENGFWITAKVKQIGKTKKIDTLQNNKELDLVGAAS